MGTSALGGTILYDAGDFDANEPLDTALLRDAVVGSALHKADEVAQVRMSWTGTISEPYREIADIDGTINVATGTLTGSAWYGFPVRSLWYPKIKANGGGYRLRVRLGGASSNGDRVDFAIVIVPRVAGAQVPILEWGSDPVGAVKYYTNETSTTRAWLTPDDGLHYIDISDYMIDAALADGVVSTIEDIAGRRTTVVAPRFEALVIGQTFDEGSVPLLYGAYIADYIGA